MSYAVTAEQVIDFFRDRKGFDWWWDDLRADIREEIREELQRLLDRR